MIKYNETNAKFNNVRFSLDNRSGYYYNSKIRKFLHVYVWEFYNGNVPEGCEIHHKDESKNNNEIDNLECLNSIFHQRMHGKKRFINDKEWFNNFHSKGIEAAKEWHKSNDGHLWHKTHYENTKNKLYEKIIKKCDVCNKKYETINNGKNRFCSNNCKTIFRRKSGIDDETRKCQYCESEFTANKYSKSVFCGRSCSNRDMWDRRRLEHGSN